MKCHFIVAKENAAEVENIGSNFLPPKICQNCEGWKSDPGACSSAASGTKTNAVMYMSNEYRYLKSNLFNYYASHGTGVHCVDVQPARTKNTWAFGGVKIFAHKKLAIPRGAKLYICKKIGEPLPNFPVWSLSYFIDSIFFSFLFSLSFFFVRASHI